MTVEELCRKLRPLCGPRIDRLYEAYLISELSDRREIETTLELLHAKVFPPFQRQSVLSPPPAEHARGEYPVGSVTYADRVLYPFGLREDDWIKHILIVGASGSGKTNTCLQLLKNLLLHHKPFLVLDWKRNYRDLLNESYADDVRVFTPGRDLVPFRFNPLIPPPGTPATAWVKKLIEVISHATYVGEGVMFLLQKALDQTYRAFGMYDTPTSYPTLLDVLKVIESMQAKGREAGWLASTLRSLGALTFGEAGRVFLTDQPIDPVTLLSQSVILELDTLTNADKTFLVESLLLWIHHYRLSSPTGKREQFEHAIILEEAHHILNKGKSDLVGGEAITETLVREIRELGEAVVIIDQCPSLLSLPARANTWCTISMNLKDAKDVQSAASAMLLDAQDKRILGELNVGEAVIKMQGRWPHAFTVRVPEVPIVKGSVTDALLRQRLGCFPDSAPESADFGPERPIQGVRKKETGITPNERALLEDIRDHPWTGVVDRYRRLRWSRRKGNEVKQEVMRKDLVKPEDIAMNNARLILLPLTAEGRHVLGLDPPTPKRPGGPQHEFWKYRCTAYYQAKGYEVSIEEALGEGKAVDLVARRSGEQIAIEVETGRSDTVANVLKCQAAGFPRILLLATTERAEAKVRRDLGAAGLLADVEVRCARQFL
jgi:hypothetical protein